MQPRYSFTVEITTPSGMTEKQATDWVQQFFDFFHPSLQAKVIINGKAVETAGEAAKAIDEALL